MKKQLPFGGKTPLASHCYRCHVVTGSQTVRPGQLYVVAAHSCSQGVLKLTSSIVRSGVYVASATVNVFPGGVTQIPLKVNQLLPYKERQLA